MIEFIWDLMQGQGIRQAQSETQATKSALKTANQKVSRQQQELYRLRNEVAELAITCQALWELTRETSHLTDQHLQDKITEIDLRDGTADGKITPSQSTPQLHIPPTP